MKNIADIDKNFKIETNIEKDDIKFYNPSNAPFKIYGVFEENGKFCRMPAEVAKATSEQMEHLYEHTAGGRIRFITDSPYVVLVTKVHKVSKMCHMAMTGSAGFDMYVKTGDEERFVGIFRPPFNVEDGFEGIIEFNAPQMREITINFPLYSGVYDLYIGLAQSAVIKEPTPYKIEKPIVYYGSSITQGGCASRPGNSYQAIISRRFDCNFINLGFSGNAMAEPPMREYIKNLDMSIFVYDYDHNAPDVEHLKNTHEAMFKEIRQANPDLPIVMMSRPNLYLNDEEKERLEIIRQTYQNAINSGDKNVYFIPGPSLMDLAGNEGTVDTCHPNDLGFTSMARKLGDLLEKIIK